MKKVLPVFLFLGLTTHLSADVLYDLDLSPETYEDGQTLVADDTTSTPSSIPFGSQEVINNQVVFNTPVCGRSDQVRFELDSSQEIYFEADILPSALLDSDNSFRILIDSTGYGARSLNFHPGVGLYLFNRGSTRLSDFEDDTLYRLKIHADVSNDLLTIDINGDQFYSGAFGDADISSIRLGLSPSTGAPTDCASTNIGVSNLKIYESPEDLFISTTALLKGRVFEDTNSNNRYTGRTDLRLDDVSVQVTDSNGTVHSVKTNKNGVYVVRDVSVGHADIVIDETTLPSLIPPEIVVGTNPLSHTVEEGVTNWASSTGYAYNQNITGEVCGYVLTDQSINDITDVANYSSISVYDKHTGLANVGVTLSSSSHTSQTVVTNDKGYYCVPKVPYGIAYSIDVNSEDTKAELGLSDDQVNFTSESIKVYFVNQVNYAPSVIVHALGF